MDANNIDQSTEAATVVALAKLAEEAVPASHFNTSDGREFMVVRNDFKLEQTTPTNKADVYKPKIVTQAVAVQTTESLVEYVNRFKNFDSMIFANITENKILGIIDYHKMPNAKRPNDPAVASTVTPDYDDAHAELCKHQVNLTLPFSLEWSTWTQNSGKLGSHRDFATFLEENAIDVLPLPARPLATTAEEADAPTTLLEMTRSLQVVQNVDFTSSVRHGDYDRVDFSKQADATAKGSIQLPLSFNLMIPVYFGEQSVQVTAFIRKKIDDGQLKIGYALHRAENVRQEEFHRIVGQVSSQVELITLYGKPSA